jgi:hypothetical protein
MNKTLRLSLLGLLLALVLVTTERAHGQSPAPAWQSAIVLGQGFTEITATATDASGNLYIAGFFQGTMVLGNTTLVSAGSLDGFVAKYQPATASFAWAMPVSGSYYEKVLALAVQGNSVYLTGHYGSDHMAIGPYTLSNTGEYDIYVAKLLDAGSTASVEWAVSAGSTDNEQPTALAVNGTSVYVTGTISDKACAFGAVTLAGAGRGDGFIAKLTDKGSTADWTWAKSIGGPEPETINVLAVAGSSLYLAGEFQGPTVAIGATTLRSSGYSNTDLFVAKLTDTGSNATFGWAKAAGSNDTKALAIAVSGANVYVGGSFAGRAAPFGSTALTALGYEGYLWKIVDTGATAGNGWARTISSFNNDTNNQVTGLVARGNNVLLTGTFDTGRASFYWPITGPGHGDVFVARLADLGNTSSVAWVQSAGGPSFETATTLVVSQDKVYVTGYSSSKIVEVGAFSLASTTTFAGYTTPFLASLTDLDLVLPTHATATALPEVAVFPSPAHAMCTVRIPAGAAQATVQLLDALGRTVRQVVAAAGQDCPLSLAGLAPGLYTARMQLGAIATVRRLEVQ